MAIRSRRRVTRRSGFRRPNRRRKQSYLRRRRIMRRRPVASRRRIANVASRKKHDTQLGATNATDPPGQQVLRLGSEYILSCPTYLPMQDTDADSRYVRERQDVFFRGVRENIFLSVTVHTSWRRVCFYSHQQFDVAKPIPDASAGYTRRNLNPFHPNVGEANADIGAYLWAGSENYDFVARTRPMARLSSQRLRVVYDKTVSINPNYPAPDGTATLGKQHVFKRWHPVNKNISYMQKEQGNQVVATTGWTTQSPVQPGNFYILDIFWTGHAHDDTEMTTSGVFETQSTMYWHER